MISKKMIFLPILAVACVGAGCATADHASVPTTSPVNQQVDHMMQMGDQTMTGESVLAGSRVVLENADGLKPGLSTLAFRVLGKDGAELKTEDLKIAHEKRMHLLLVRDDMTQFQHLHPEYIGGAWRVVATIPEQGDYQMYIDIAPEKETAIVLRVPLKIGGSTLTKVFPEPSADMSATDQDVKATVTTDGAFKTGMTKKITFTLTKNGQTLKQIDPYLGAFGHVVLLRHTDPAEFLHVHPLTEVAPVDGKVVFETAFSEAGRYTLYAQFSTEGKVKTFPITIDVEEGEMVSMPGMNHGSRHE